MPYLVAHVASSCVLQAAGGSDDSLVLVLHIELHFEEQHPCGSPLLRSPNTPRSQFTTQCSSQASPQTLSPITVRHATLYCGSCTCIKCVRECLPIRTLTACSPARSAARLPAHLCMCLHIRASTHTHTHMHTCSARPCSLPRRDHRRLSHRCVRQQLGRRAVTKCGHCWMQ